MGFWTVYFGIEGGGEAVVDNPRVIGIITQARGGMPFTSRRYGSFAGRTLFNPDFMRGSLRTVPYVAGEISIEAYISGDISLNA